METQNFKFFLKNSISERIGEGGKPLGDWVIGENQAGSDI